VTGVVGASGTCPNVREVPRDPIRTYGDDLAVVTVARPGTPSDALQRTVGSVAGATTRPVRIVLADSSVDGLAEVPAGVDVVALGEDVGRGAAVNRAVTGLADPVGWVALADPGVVLHPGSLDVLLGAAVPRAGALGPQLDGAGPGLGGDLPGPLDVLRGRGGTSPRAGAVGWLPATCLLLRRAALDSVDGFDPRYPGPLDDVDLAHRLGRAGWLVLHVPEAGATAHPQPGPAALEPIGAARRRYLHDRSPAPTRVLLALATRGRG
jgi:N-acetylglucosaminyl-diphospho-decaprenol L-rhamnosyltransferase